MGHDQNDGESCLLGRIAYNGQTGCSGRLSGRNRTFRSARLRLVMVHMEELWIVGQKAVGERGDLLAAEIYT
jgi:hypothetical protein